MSHLARCSGVPTSSKKVPGSTYCSVALNSGSGSIDTSTWVVTTASLGSNSVPTHGTTEVDTNLAMLNTGDPTSTPLPTFFTGLPAAFSADSGSLDPSSTTLDGNMAASSTYTAPAVAGSDVVTVVLDREEFAGLPRALAANAASYNAAVITGEPVELPLTITPVVDPDPDPDPGPDGNVDDNGADGDESGGVADGDGTLTDTGSDVSSWQLPLSIAMIAGGAAFAAAGRRRPTVGRHRLA